MTEKIFGFIGLIGFFAIWGFGFIAFTQYVAGVR